jgi:excisionase family DNA binding protein
MPISSPPTEDPKEGNDVTTRSLNQPVKPEDLNAPYFNIREAAWLLKCSVKTVRRRINEDGYPHSRTSAGGPILISREDLPYYYEANRVHATPIRRTRGRRKPAASAA